MSNKPFFVSSLLFVATILVVILVYLRGYPVVALTNLENIPMHIIGFSATEDFFSESVYEELDADFHVYRHYKSPEGDQVNLYIGYYGTAKGGRTPHNPYACLPSVGWSIIEAKRVEVKSDSFPDGVALNHILSKKNNVYNVVLHWYQSSGNKVLSSGVEQNMQRFVSKLLHNRNDGAFIRVSCSVEGDGLDHCTQLTRKFASEILDYLPLHWPVEKEE